MQYGIAFTPLVPSIVLWIAIAAIIVIAGLLLLGRARGAAVRVTALALIVLALANPSFTREDREPLSSDLPVDRVAASFLITDWRVHDIPANVTALGFQAPVHALITGRKDERDRRIEISAAPRFGIVGQTHTITYRLDDQGVSGDRAKVVVRRDGEVINERTVLSGQTVNVDIDIKHSGPNIVEIEASPLENELTPVNNRAVVAIDGVRDKLRVLLVSGEPHSGERTWRNLLKSDPSVDLVHFTILRPPE